MRRITRSKIVKRIGVGHKFSYGGELEVVTQWKLGGRLRWIKSVEGQN